MMKRPFTLSLPFIVLQSCEMVSNLISIPMSQSTYDIKQHPRLCVSVCSVQLRYVTSTTLTCNVCGVVVTTERPSAQTESLNIQALQLNSWQPTI